jgi:hypothetical protein
MAGNGLAIVAGVGLSENHHVGVVRSGVKTYGEPQTPCAAQRQAPKDAVKSNADRVYPVLMRFKEGGGVRRWTRAELRPARIQCPRPAF